MPSRLMTVLFCRILKVVLNVCRVFYVSMMLVCAIDLLINYIRSLAAKKTPLNPTSTVESFMKFLAATATGPTSVRPETACGLDSNNTVLLVVIYNVRSRPLRNTRSIKITASIGPRRRSSRDRNAGTDACSRRPSSPTKDVIH